MKSLKYLLAIGALTAAFVLPVQAHLEFQGAIGKADVGNNSPDADLEALGIVLGQDVSNFTLCGNFETGLEGDHNYRGHAWCLSCRPLRQRQRRDVERWRSRSLLSCWGRNRGDCPGNRHERIRQRWYLLDQGILPAGHEYAG